MEQLEEKFNSTVKKWEAHCEKTRVRFSSSPKPVRDCDAYREIVSMGNSSLPLIRKLYDKDSQNNIGLSGIQAFGLISAVKDIIGDDFTIPEDIRGNIKMMEDYTKRWLDNNINKYC